MRLGWQSLPQHDDALLLLVGVVAAALGILYLYRREGKLLSRGKRITLASLRFLTMAGVLAMLLEPAIIFTKRETIPSRLLVLVDDSESLDFKDAYVDAKQAKRIVDTMQFKSIDELRDQSRSKLAQRALDRGLMAKLAESGDRIVSRHDFSGQLFDPQPVSESGACKNTVVGNRPQHHRYRHRGETGIGRISRSAVGRHPDYHRRPVEHGRASA